MLLQDPPLTHASFEVGVTLKHSSDCRLTLERSNMPRIDQIYLHGGGGERHTKPSCFYCGSYTNQLSSQEKHLALSVSFLVHRLGDRSPEVKEHTRSHSLVCLVAKASRTGARAKCLDATKRSRRNATRTLQGRPTEINIPCSKSKLCFCNLGPKH